MNWDAIGAMGQVLGSIAVFVTLAYLAVQTRQNTQAVTTSIFEAAMEGFNEWNRLVCGSNELCALLLRALEASEELSSLEYTRLNHLTRAYANQQYKLFGLYERGVFPEEEWRNCSAEAVQLFSTIPHFVSFKAKNHFYDDMWAELSRHEVVGFSDVGTRR
jgi:hypothetical protein